MPAAAFTLLLLDDENHLRQGAGAGGLRGAGGPDARRALHLLSGHPESNVILSDVKLPDGHSVDLRPRYRAKTPLAEIVLLTAYDKVPDGGRAVKTGAFDYLTKGNSDDQLLVVAVRAAEQSIAGMRSTDFK